MKKLTSIEIRERINNKNPNLILPDNLTTSSKIQISCSVCSAKYTINTRTLLERNCNCLGCLGQICVKGYNDIATKAPNLIKYLYNKEDAYKYTPQSNKKIEVICPDCSHIRKIQVSKLNNRRWSCPACSDSVSYPNKFSRALLNQLSVKNIIFEYNPDWAKPYRYDNYFEYNDKKYILEMDGGLGHGNEDFHHLKDIKGLKVDKLKDRLAKNNDIEVIRIDCLFSDFEYIKENLIKSKLNELFDLSKIDWQSCEKFAITSYVKMICDYYNSGNNISTIDIQRKFKIGVSTARRYLKQGAKIGLCNYSIEKAQEISKLKKRDKKQNRSPKKTIVYKNNIKIGEYLLLKDAINDLNNKFPDINFNFKSVGSKLLRDNDLTTYKGFKFERIRTI